MKRLYYSIFSIIMVQTIIAMGCGACMSNKHLHGNPFNDRTLRAKVCNCPCNQDPSCTLSEKQGLCSRCGCKHMYSPSFNSSEPLVQQEYAATQQSGGRWISRFVSLYRSSKVR